MAANATAVWRVRPSGSNTNGGGYDSGIASAGTDRSQQDAAYLSNIGTVTTATVTLTDTGASFTTDLIGNGIYVAGTSITTTRTFITGVPSSTTLTLQTSPGTAGTAVTYYIGGGWADFWTNTTAAAAWLVPGNTVYILGGASPSYGSPDYTYTGIGFAPVSGNATAGFISFIGDPLTSAANGYGGRPVISGGTNGAVLFLHANYMIMQNCLIFCATAATPQQGFFTNTAATTLINMVLDQNGYDSRLVYGAGGTLTIIGGEYFSSTTVAIVSSYPAILNVNSATIFGANIHDLGAVAVNLTGNSGFSVTNCIIAKNGGAGISLSGTNNFYANIIANNTIDANKGSGILIGDQQTLQSTNVFNNIISNHVTAATYGISISAGTATANSAVRSYVDYNTFYNNTANYNAINAGPHDTATGSNPYTAQSTENYTLI